MADTMIVKLRRQEAIDAIKGTETVFYHHGCWNTPVERKTSEVIETIKDLRACPYGADVWKYKDTYIVCIPCESDMW